MNPKYNNPEELLERAIAFKAKTSALVKDREAFLELVKQKEKDLKTLDTAIDLASKCIEEGLSNKVHIESIITKGLCEVFGRTYEFEFEILKELDGTVKGLKPKISKEGSKYGTPEDMLGTGEIKIASICCVIAVVLLSNVPNVVVLDEPLANISTIFQDRLNSFITNVANETNLQIIMTTHMDKPFGDIWSITPDSSQGLPFAVVKKVN